MAARKGWVLSGSSRSPIARASSAQGAGRPRRGSSAIDAVRRFPQGAVSPPQRSRLQTGTAAVAEGRGDEGSPQARSAMRALHDEFWPKTDMTQALLVDAPEAPSSPKRPWPTAAGTCLAANALWWTHAPCGDNRQTDNGVTTAPRSASFSCRSRAGSTLSSILEPNPSAPQGRAVPPDPRRRAPSALRCATYSRRRSIHEQVLAPKGRTLTRSRRAATNRSAGRTIGSRCLLASPQKNAQTTSKTPALIQPNQIAL